MRILTLRRSLVIVIRPAPDLTLNFKVFERVVDRIATRVIACDDDISVCAIA